MLQQEGEFEELGLLQFKDVRLCFELFSLERWKQLFCSDFREFYEVCKWGQKKTITMLPIVLMHIFIGLLLGWHLSKGRCIPFLAMYLGTEKGFEPNKIFLLNLHSKLLTVILELKITTLCNASFETLKMLCLYLLVRIVYILHFNNK